MKDLLFSDAQLKMLDKVVEDGLREALLYDKGYIIFSVNDPSLLSVDYYYSHVGELRVDYGESIDETKEKICFVLECKTVRENVNYENKFDIIKYCMINHIKGMACYCILNEKLHVSDFVTMFNTLKLE